MLTSKTLKVLCFLLAAVLMTSACVMLAGCEAEDKADATAAATTAATTAPTVAATSAPAATEAVQGTEALDYTVDSEGYIPKETAIANVKQQAGSGATIVSAEKGFAPDGAACWIVVVKPITTGGSNPETVTYYSGYLFCYPEGTDFSGSMSDDLDEDGFISQETAIANVKQSVAYEITVISCTKGYSNDGAPAWYVAFTYTDENGQEASDVYVSGYQFCYRTEQ